MIKSSYSILCSTVSAVAITLVMSGLDAREAIAQPADCSPAAGTDISTIVGGVNAQDYICESANAPLVNEVADQSTFTNSGTIKNTNSVPSFFNPITASFHSTLGIGTFENSGTVGNLTSNTGVGLLLDSGASSDPSTAIVSVLSNTSTGQIVSYDNTALSLRNGAKITTLNNSGAIKSVPSGPAEQSLGIDMLNDSPSKNSEIGVLNNLETGSISGLRAIQVRNRSIITTINNDGEIFGVESVGGTYGIRMQDDNNRIGTLNNTGSIYSLGADTSSGSLDAETSTAIRLDGEVTNISNSGRIYSVNGDGVRTDSSGAKIGTLTNTGAIYGGRIGINYRNNSANFGTFNNAQGGDGSTEFTTALTYRGILPSNYNIIINSASHYGQLKGVDTPSGTMNFGISDLSGRVTELRYDAVLSGLEYEGSGSGVYRGANWSLEEDGENIWDLVFSSLPLYNPSLEQVVAVPLSARSASFSQQFDGSRVVMHLAESRKRKKTIIPTADVIYEGEQSDDTASMSQTIGATTFFGIIRGAWADFNAVGDNPEYSANAWGMTFGAEHRFSGLDATLGVFGSYSETDSENSSSEDSVSNIGGGIHGNKELGAGFWFDAYGAYYHHDHDITRVDGGDTYTADPDGRTWTAYGRLSYADWDFSGLAFTPYVAANYVDQVLDAYEENGSGAAALSVDEDKNWNVLTYVGTTLSADVPLTESVSLLPKLDVAWVHLMKDGERDVTTTFVGGTDSFAATIAGADQDFARVEASLGLSLDGGLAMRVDYATELGNSDVEKLHEVRLEATYQF